ncbi:hypothetical protein SEPCBS119000_006702 [Sporothrix epigloea]|uniref:Uncharacterized protein n=1 Tax=Sporothrix epigloea TaxID=1892477 RepID=A0ABP0E8R0_9PEZI
MTTKPKKTIKALDSEATVLRKQVGALEELVAELQQRLDEVEKRLKSAEAAPRTFAEVVASKRPVSTVLLKPERGHRVLIKVGDNNKLSDQTIKDRPREESLSILKFRLGSEAVRQVRRLPDGNVAASLRDDVEDGEAWLQPTFGDHARITNGGTPVIIKGIPHDIIDEFTVDRLRKAGTRQITIFDENLEALMVDE